MGYINYKKNELKKLTISDINLPIPELQNVNKTKVIAEFLMEWLNSGNYTNCLLPTKAEFAYFFGISLGSVQNVLKILEDNNYIFLKQKIGAIVKDKMNSSIKRQTSKSDIVLSKLKLYIQTSNLNKGDKLLSSRKLATILNCPLNSIRLAVNNLLVNGVLNTNSEGKIVINNKKSNISDDIVSETLVKKVKEEVKEFIINNYKIGEKIPSHKVLADKFKVSVKTMHNAVKILEKENILLSRRGTYGTIVTSTSTNLLDSKPEMSIFASAVDTAFYHYEKTQNKIKKMIADDYGIGSKLPSIKELSIQLDLSPNTIRKSLNNLAKEGILRFARGRYGGTFIMDMPDIKEQTFRWLAVNPQYSKINN